MERLRWFYELGLRRGEVLNVKIPDINFRSAEVLIKVVAMDSQSSAS